MALASRLGARTVGGQRLRRRSAAPTSSPRPVAPEATVTKEQKKQTVEKMRGLLEDAYLVAGLNYEGMDVLQFQTLRRSLPEGVTLTIAKNRLMRTATAGTSFEPLAKDVAAKGMNAWLVVGEDVAPAIKAVNGQIKLLKQEEGLEDLDWSGGVMDGQPLDPAGLKACENLPTKVELITKMAVMTKQITTKVALATKAIPRKVAYGVKAVADGESDVITE